MLATNSGVYDFNNRSLRGRKRGDANAAGGVASLSNGSGSIAIAMATDTCANNKYRTLHERHRRPHCEKQKNQRVKGSTMESQKTPAAAKSENESKIEIGVDTKALLPRQAFYARGITGFFPPVKLRTTSMEMASNRANQCKLSVDSKSRRTPQFLIELAPEPPSNTPNGCEESQQHINSISGRSSSIRLQGTSTSTASPTRDEKKALVYPHIETSSNSCNDLSYLPQRPRMIVSRDTPWVYRHKVKKAMNELSKIMASRPPRNVVR